MIGCIDDDFLVRFNPNYISTTSEMSSTGRLAEEMDLIMSKTAKEKLSLDDTVPESAGGTAVFLAILNWQWQHQIFPMLLLFLVVVSLVISIDIGHCVKEHTPSPRNDVNSGNSIGISEVDCSQSGMEMVKTAPPDSSGYVADFRIADLPPAD
jgi:hypothetical protein